MYMLLDQVGEGDSSSRKNEPAEKNPLAGQQDKHACFPFVVPFVDKTKIIISAQNYMAGVTYSV